MKQIIIILFLGSIILYGKSLENLRSQPIPDKKEVRKLNWQPNAYKVYLDEGQIKYHIYQPRIPKTKVPFKIKPTKDNAKYLDSKTSNTIFELDNGWLIGFDKGEWGGALYWFDKNGDHSYEITTGNIKDIVKVGNKIYVLEGLAHRDSNDGQILQLMFKRQKWTATPYFDLNKVPYVSASNEKNKLIIITSDEVIEFSVKKKKTKSIYKGFWNILYPNSLVIEDSNCYVGMRGGVFKIQLDKPESQEWFTE